MDILLFLAGAVVGFLAGYFYFKDKLRFYKESRESLEQNLKTLINNNLFELLKKNNEEFLRLTEKLISDFYEKSRLNYEKQSVELKHLISPLKENLERYKKLVDELGEKNTANFSKFSEKIDMLIRLEGQLRNETQKLSKALNNQIFRGSWAENQLERILELTGMKKHIDYQMHESAKGSKSKPDLVIYLPGGKKIIVDSKSPLNNYLKFLEASTERERQEYLKKHKQNLENRIKELATKKYWQEFENTPEFVIMYIHIENALTSVLDIDKDLILKALEKNVILATPATFLALLQTVSFVWKQYEINENAGKIIKIAQKLADNTENFLVKFAELQKTIDKLQTVYNKSLDEWHKNFKPSLDELKNFGININN